MPSTIISDTSCLIALDNIGELALLPKLYKQITTTSIVAKEFGGKLPDWIEIVNPKDKLHQQILELYLDEGEASAIALALEISNSTIILDDEKARKAAEKLKLKITGTLGIISKAKNNGIIHSIKPYLLKLKTAGFRLTEKLENMALKESGEL
jgi:predicted nucleic acid-binding protein